MPDAPPPPEDFYPEPTDHLVTFGDDIGFDASAVIHVRQRWGDNWTLQDQLVCTSVTWAAAPTLPTASLTYRYGPTLERDGSTSGNRAKIALGGWYVRITITCPDGVRKWHGFVDDTADEPAGFVSGFAAGTMTFSCLGMIAALDRSQIFNCFYETQSADQLTGFVERRVGMSAPAFNPKSNLADEPGHQRQIKNRSTALYDVSSFEPSTFPVYPVTRPDIERQTYLLFWPDLLTMDTRSGEYWTPRDIVKYLIAYHGPRDQENIERIPIWLYEDNSIAEDSRALPNWGQPELDCEGKTLKVALDELMSQRQSLGYWTWVDDLTNRLMIEPYTLLESDLTAATGKVITANPKYLDMVVAGDPATNYTVQRNESSLANQVVIRGAKRIAVCTLRIDNTGGAFNANLILDGTGITEFNAEFPQPPATLRDQYRIGDALHQGRYKNLYRNFQIGKRWNWKVQIGDVFASATFEDIFRNDDPDINVVYGDDNSRYLPYMYRVKVLPNLPLKEGIDYSTGYDSMALEHRNSSKAFRELEVWGKAHGPNWSGGSMTGHPKEWTNPAKRDVLYDVNDPDYSLEANPIKSDSGLGVALNVVGASQLIFGGSNVGITPFLPQTSLLVTLALEDDRHVSQHWPETAPTVDGVLRRVFDYGDANQLVEILAGTVLGVAGDATFKRRSDRFFVRDDRPRMLELAKQLHKWYATPRNISRVTSRRLSAVIWPGQLIKKLNPSGGTTNPHEAICNCVITEVGMQFPIGTPASPGKPSMSIVTSRGEIDPMIFQPRLS
jgi:hypothetical protein